jgi:hypothetical protein
MPEGAGIFNSAKKGEKAHLQQPHLPSWTSAAPHEDPDGRDVGHEDAEAEDMAASTMLNKAMHGAFHGVAPWIQLDKTCIS